MAKKEAKSVNTEERGEESTYRATLKVGDSQLANITLRATDDEDAKEQLERSKPTYFDGVGEWTLTKTETVEVK